MFFFFKDYMSIYAGENLFLSLYTVGLIFFVKIYAASSKSVLGNESAPCFHAGDVRQLCKTPSD